MYVCVCMYVCVRGGRGTFACPKSRHTSTDDAIDDAEEESSSSPIREDDTLPAAPSATVRSCERVCWARDWVSSHASTTPKRKGYCCWCMACSCSSSAAPSRETGSTAASRVYKLRCVIELDEKTRWSRSG